MADERDISLMRTILFGALVVFGVLPAAALLPNRESGTRKQATNAEATTAPQTLRQVGREPGALGLLEEHFAVKAPPGAGDSERVAELLKQLKPGELRILIATLPDPIESHVRLLFDPSLDAIQHAAAEGEFALQYFWLPIPRRNEESTDKRGLVSPVEPGAVLFRGRDSLLMVLLVPETPTGGVHHAVLDRALHLTTSLTSDPELLILGPFFSATTDSLIRVLHRWLPSLETKTIRVISGTAASLLNRREFAARLGNRVAFHSTSFPDEELQYAMEDYLKARDRNVRVGLLVEANTWFGQQASSPGGTKCATPEGRKRPPPFCDALRIPYPLHISRSRPLREEATDASRTVRAQPLPLEGTHAASDRVPPMTPETTEPSMALALTNLLRTLQRESINVVGLIATDWRDKLFLATLISQNCPGIRIFSTRADLPYAHPDFAPATRGMLVASTYSAFAESEVWLGGGGRERRQFAHSLSPGIYNAFLLLVFHDASGRPRQPSTSSVESTAKQQGSVTALSEYYDRRCLAEHKHKNAQPKSCRPGIWISLVGNDALFPVGQAQPALGHETDNYLAPYHPDPALLETASPRPVRRFDLMITVVVWLLLHVFAYVHIRREQTDTACPAWRTWRMWNAGCAPFVRRCSVEGAKEDAIAARTVKAGSQPSPEHKWRRHVYAAVAFMALLPMCVTAAALLFVHVHAFSDSPLSKFLLSVFAVTALALLLASLHAGVLYSRRPLDDLNRHERAAWLSHEAFRAFILFATGSAAVLMLVVYMAAQIAEIPTSLRWLVNDGVHRLEGGPFLARALALASGVSPLVPILALASATYLWAMFHLRRSGMPRASRVALQLESLEEELRGEFVLDRSASTRYISCTKEAAGRLQRVLTPTVLVTMAISALVLIPAVRTVDGLFFDWFYVGAFIVVQVLVVVTLVRFAGVWIALRRFLQLLEGHPLLAAFDRLPREMRTTRTLGWTPRTDDIGPLVQRWDHVRSQLLDRPALLTEWTVCHPTISAVPPALAQIRSEFERERGQYSADAWAASHALRLMRDWDGAIWAIARRHWSVSPPAPPVPIRERRRRSREGEVAIQLAVRTSENRGPGHGILEEFVALETLLSVRDVLGRLVNSVGFVAIANILMIVSHSMYAVHPAKLLFTISAVNVSAAALVIWPVLAQAERNETLSRIAGTASGQLAWDWAFIYRILVYGVFPVAALLATQFPGVWGSTVDWLTSFKSVLP